MFFAVYPFEGSHWHLFVSLMSHVENRKLLERGMKQALHKIKFGCFKLWRIVFMIYCKLYRSCALGYTLDMVFKFSLTACDIKLTVSV